MWSDRDYTKHLKAPRDVSNKRKEKREKKNEDITQQRRHVKLHYQHCDPAHVRARQKFLIEPLKSTFKLKEVKHLKNDERMQA